MRPSLRVLAGFVLRFLLVYGLLLVPWPGLRETSGSCYRAAARVLVAPFWRGGVLEIRALQSGAASPGAGDADSEIVLHRPFSARVGHLSFDSRVFAYLPAAFLVALVLATPASRGRRARALLWGLGAVGVFALVRLAAVVWALQAAPASAADSTGAAGRGWMALQEIAAARRLVASGYLVPVLIWIVTMFRGAIPGLAESATQRVRAAEPRRADARSRAS